MRLYVADVSHFLGVRGLNSSPPRAPSCGEIPCLGLKALDGHEAGPQGTDFAENRPILIRMCRGIRFGAHLRPGRPNIFQNCANFQMYTYSILGTELLAMLVNILVAQIEHFKMENKEWQVGFIN